MSMEKKQKRVCRSFTDEFKTRALRPIWCRMLWCRSNAAPSGHRVLERRDSSTVDAGGLGEARSGCRSDNAVIGRSWIRGSVAGKGQARLDRGGGLR